MNNNTEVKKVEKTAQRASGPNPYAFGTSGISPAEQARMPEASRDRSLGTLAKKMKRPFIVILGLIVLLAAYVGWRIFNTISTSTAPMISMSLTLSAAGKPLPAESIKKVEYCFSSEPASKGEANLKGNLCTAWTEEGSFILNGPYSITRYGFSRPVTEPLYRSLIIRVTLSDQKSFVLFFPMISSTKMSGPIHVDLPQ